MSLDVGGASVVVRRLPRTAAAALEKDGAEGYRLIFAIKSSLRACCFSIV